MKRIILAAVGAAVTGLTACSHAAAPTAAAASHGHAPVPVSCHQQYRAWAHGHGKGLMPTLDAVSAAATSGGTHALTVALKNARPAIARAARHPIPACADPRGYWDVLLMHVNAAAATSGSASGKRAAMKGVPKIEHALTAEVKSNT